MASSLYFGFKKFELHERFYYFKTISSIIDPMNLCFKSDIEIIFLKKKKDFYHFDEIKTYNYERLVLESISTCTLSKIPVIDE